MTNWRQILGYRTEPQTEFSVGDLVRILNKSIGCNVGDFLESKGDLTGDEEIWEIESINLVGSEKWRLSKKRSSELDEPVYVISGHWFIAKDLEKVND